jgi:hypothetical protein
MSDTREARKQIPAKFIEPEGVRPGRRGQPQSEILVQRIMRQKPRPEDSRGGSPQNNGKADPAHHW